LWTGRRIWLAAAVVIALIGSAGAMTSWLTHGSCFFGCGLTGPIGWIIPIGSLLVILLVTRALLTRVPKDLSSGEHANAVECPQCGRALLEDWRLCPYCGFAFDLSTDTPSMVPER
jgi:hypothetical protein